MGLTSPALVIVLAVAAIAVLVSTLWWWPRLAGRGIRLVLSRIAALGMLQVSVLGLIFVTVNRSAEFYSSWADLFGTDTASAAVVAVGHGSVLSAAPVTVTASSAVAVPGKPRAAGGRLEVVRFHGQLSGITAPGYVYLPPGYPAATDQAGHGQPPLPAVVVISDQVADQGAPYGAARLAATAAMQIAAGRLAPVILVMLPAWVGPADQACLDVPGGAQAATFFSQDLPQAMESAYRVAAGPGGWALLGDSSGGYCALQLAMTDSQVFSVAVAPPGDYTTPPGSGLFGGSPQIATQDSLLWRLRHEPMQPVSVLFAGPGPGEPFLSLARRPMRVASVGLTPGEWSLAPVLDWVGRTLGSRV